MKIVNDILFIEFRELTSLSIPYTTIVDGIREQSKSWQSIPDPEDNRKVLVKYDTLRPIYKNLVVSVLCKGLEPHEYLHEQELKKQLLSASYLQELIPTTAKSLMKLSELTAFKNQFGETKGHQYAMAAGYLRLVASINGPRDARKFGFKSKTELLNRVIKELQVHSPLCRITNPVYLSVKAKAFINEGVSALISKSIGNFNRSKVGELQLSTLAVLLADRRKFTISQIALQYSVLAKDNGWEPITERRVRQLLDDPRVQNMAAKRRYGGKYLHDNVLMVVNRKQASHPDALWIADGTPFELYFYENGKLGRFYIFTVLDSFSLKVVGYSISESETGAAVYDAFKMAATVNQVLPYQILTDNGSGIKNATTKDFLDRLSIYNISTKVGNARAKRIEPFYGHLNRSVLKYYDNHSGGNITAKKLETHVNPDFIKENYKSFPNKAETMYMISQSIEIWNAAAGDQLAINSTRLAPNVLYQDQYENRRELTFELQVDLFWQWRMRGYDDKARKLEYTYTFEGLTVEVEGEPIKYIAPEAGSAHEIATFFHNHLHEKFHVKFDRDNLDAIAIYNLKGQFVSYAQRKTLIPEALVDFQEGDRTNLNKYLTVQKLQREIADTEMEAQFELVEAAGILKGGITREQMFKDVMNDAESAIKRHYNITDRYPKPKQSYHTPEDTGGDLYKPDESELGGLME